MWDLIYLTESPQGPVVCQFILPGKIPAPFLPSPKGLDEGTRLPVIHTGLGSHPCPGQSMTSGIWGDRRVTWSKTLLPKPNAFWRDEEFLATLLSANCWAV